jgi:hypothetical protein
VDLNTPVKVPRIFQNLFTQTAVAVLFYTILILFSSNLLELSPNQPLFPNFSIRGDKGLSICILNWDLETARGDWKLGITEAPIFYPSKYARFYSEHLFGHLLYAYPVSIFVKSPLWIFNLTYQLNRLTIATAAFLLCLWLTSSFLPSLIAGGWLIYSWHFGQLPNTGLGWAILAILFFCRHLIQPRWLLAAGFAFFLIVASLCSGYVVFFSPIAILALMVPLVITNRGLLSRTWRTQILTALVVILIALAPTMWTYKKTQKYLGLIRYGFSTAKFTLPVLNAGGDESEDTEPDENQRIFRLSRAAALQVLVASVGLVLILFRKLRFGGWQYSFACLAVLSFWMASSQYSPYWLVSNLPGFNGLRAIQRWYLFLSLSLTVLDAMLLTWLVRKQPMLTRGALLIFLIGWIFAVVTPQKESFRLPRLRPGYEVYSYLATLPPAPICILPIIDSAKPNSARVNSARMIYQLWHRFPMISGYSGFTPPLNSIMESAILRKGISKSIVTKLGRTGVRYIVVDPMLGETSILRRSVSSVPRVRILYQRGEQMVAEIPQSIPITDMSALLEMWSRSLRD